MFPSTITNLNTAIEKYHKTVYTKVESGLVVFLASINDPNKLAKGEVFEIEDANIKNVITESEFALSSAKSILGTIHLELKYDIFNNKLTATRTKEKTITEYTVDATTIAADYILGKLIDKITPDIEKDGSVIIPFEGNEGFSVWFNNPLYKTIMESLIKTTGLKYGITDKDVTFYIDGKFSNITGYSKGI